MKGLDDGPDGLNEAAFDRALGLRRNRVRRARKPAVEAPAASSAAAQPTQPVPPAQRYIDAFAAIAAIGADLVLDERSDSGAAAALESWAAASHRPMTRIEQGPGSPWSHCLRVATGTPFTVRSRSIDVYVPA